MRPIQVCSNGSAFGLEWSTRESQCQSLREKHSNLTTKYVPLVPTTTVNFCLKFPLWFSFISFSIRLFVQTKASRATETNSFWPQHSCGPHPFCVSVATAHSFNKLTFNRHRAHNTHETAYSGLAKQMRKRNRIWESERESTNSLHSTHNAKQNQIHRVHRRPTEYLFSIIVGENSNSVCVATYKRMDGYLRTSKIRCYAILKPSERERETIRQKAKITTLNWSQ